MPTSRVAQAKLLTNPSVQQQLTASLLVYSIGVLTEGTIVVGHVNRLKFANAIIAQPTFSSNFMLPALLSNANIVASAGNALDANGTPLLDADVDAVVNTVFTLYANQYVASGNTNIPLQLGS